MEPFSINLVYEGGGDDLNRNWFARGEDAHLKFVVQSSVRALLSFYVSPFDFPSDRTKVYETEVKPGEQELSLVVGTRDLRGLYQVIAEARQLAEMEASSEPGVPISNWKRVLGDAEYVYKVEREIDEGTQTDELVFPVFKFSTNGTSAMPKYNYQTYPWMIAVLNNFSREINASGLPPLKVPLGLGINLYYEKALKLAEETKEAEEAIKLMKLAGVGLIRLDLPWSIVEKERGKYDFSLFEKLAKKLVQRGIRPLFILDYANKLYDEGLSPHTDEAVEAFSNYAREAVKALSQYDPIWELWNEPNGFWWPKPDPEAYVKLSMATLKKISGSGQTVIGPSLGSFDYAFLVPFLQALEESGLYGELAAVSVHPYRTRSWGPETATPEYEALKKISKKTVVNSEWGYPADRSAGTRSLNALRQAEFFARIYLTDLMNQVPMTVLHDWQDDGTDPFYWEHCYGVIQSSQREEAGSSPQTTFFIKPNYYALHQLSYELNGYSFVDYVRSPQGIYVLRFQKGELTKYAVWSTTGKQEFTLKVRGEKATLTHLFGKIEEIYPRDGLFRVPASESPAFLKIQRGLTSSPP